MPHGLSFHANLAAMVGKPTPAAGWVVQLTIIAQQAPISGVRGAVPPTPVCTLQFWNVAVGDPEQAVAAARKKAGAPSDAPMRVVRALSAAEVAALGLRQGEAKLA